MADLVSDGGEFSCNFCASKLKLSVIISSSTGNSQKLANQTNCFLPPPGGTCTLIPGIPPPPCVGAPPGMVVETGQTTVKVDGQTALGDGCKFMCPLGQPVTLSKAGQEVAKHDEASTALEVASLALDVLPVVGSGKSFMELMSGKDPVTGEETSRISALGGIILGVIPGGKILLKGKKAAKIIKKAMKTKPSKALSKQVPKAANDNIKHTYQAAPYHGKTNQGLKSRGPTNGQSALDNSVQVKSTSPRRVAVDKKSGEYVVFDKTSDNVYHGHVREWADLHPDMQNALINSNQVKVVNGAGKIIK